MDILTGQKSRGGSYVCDGLSARCQPLTSISVFSSTLVKTETSLVSLVGPLLTGSIINPVHVCLTLTDSFSFLVSPTLSLATQQNISNIEIFTFIVQLYLKSRKILINVGIISVTELERRLQLLI